MLVRLFCFVRVIVSKVNIFFKFIYLFIFRKGGREVEIEREKYQLVASHMPQPGTWPSTQACALTGNLTSDLSVCSSTPNPLSHTSQG